MFILDYLGRCFYQLSSAEKPNRAGTSRTLLSLFCLFALLDGYTLVVLLLNIRPQFGLAALGCFVGAQLLVRAYARRPGYRQRVARYAEPARVHLALVGAGALMAVCLLPLVLLRLLPPG